MLKAKRQMHSSASCVTMPEYAVTPMLSVLSHTIVLTVHKALRRCARSFLAGQAVCTARSASAKC